MALPASNRSAAIQIVRPPISPEAKGDLPVASEKKRGDGTQRLCRNVLIFGACKYQNQGCAYYHPKPGEDVVATPAESPTLTAPSLVKDKSGLGANLSAPVFVPKTPANDASPGKSTSTVQLPERNWPALSGSGLLGGAMTPAPMTYDESPFMADHSSGMEAAMLFPQSVRPQLEHHLYTPALPYLTTPPITKHPLHSFFIPDDIRHMVQARQEATYSGADSSTLGVPSEVGTFHSLLPLERGQIPISRVYGHPAPVYRAVSSVDGNVYCLRRIEGYKLVDENAFRAMETWKQMRHPNIVGLREAFTTRAFNDNSLILVYDFHPNSISLHDEHLNPDNMSINRRRVVAPIPERLLWSYVSQIANALKAVHSSGLSARNLDPSKIILTGKNRIRLNGVGVLDVLAYDANTPISMYQMEDLVSFGKLVITLCCEFFVPGQHPAGPIEYIARHYSPDVKNLILFLISKPQPGKVIDEVVRMLGLRVLNEFDAIQNYVDVLESELVSEVENGRIVRLLTKLGFINERAEFELDPRWSDTGDRYILKLFRDYVFHSIGVDGNPILDLSHVLTCLNKLDAGLDERIMLVSRDDQSCLVVSYREIKSCIEAAYNDLRNAGSTRRR